MNIDSILISNFAQNTDGGLTVVGVFNHLVADTVPAAAPVMFLTIVIHAHIDEVSTPHKGEIHLLNARREPVRPPFAFEFSFAPPEKGVPGLPFRHIYTVGMYMAQFTEIGPYAFEVHLDGTYCGGTAFYVGPAR